MMRNLQYDAEGDILSVTFVDAEDQPQTGVELNDNIVFYYNPETDQPIKLILVSYQRLAEASLEQPILLEGLADIPTAVRDQVLRIIVQPPVSSLLHLFRPKDSAPASRLDQIFTPTTLQALAA
jgi:hypothetical protein